MFQPSFLTFYLLVNPSYESKDHTRAPDTYYRHSQCLCLLIYKITVLLLIELKGELRDLPEVWLGSSGWSPVAEHSNLLTHTTPHRGEPLLMKCCGIMEGKWFLKLEDFF